MLNKAALLMDRWHKVTRNRTHIQVHSGIPSTLHKVYWRQISKYTQYTYIYRKVYECTKPGHLSMNAHSVMTTVRSKMKMYGRIAMYNILDPCNSPMHLHFFTLLLRVRDANCKKRKSPRETSSLGLFLKMPLDVVATPANWTDAQ